MKGEHRSKNGTPQQLQTKTIKGTGQDDHAKQLPEQKLT